ncbi:MAG: porin [Pseudomonadota bacterium]
MNLARADAPSVEMHGEVDFAIPVINQSKYYANISDDQTTPNARNTNHTSKYKFYTDTELSAIIKGASELGYKYEANIVFDVYDTPRVVDFIDAEGETRVTNSKYDGGVLRLKNTNVKLGTSYGKFEVGGTKSAAAGLKVKMPTLKHVDALDLINSDVGVNYGDVSGQDGATKAEVLRFLKGASLPTDHTGKQKRANKIVYYTPKFSGLQFGVSFTQNSNNNGTIAGFTSKYNSTSNSDRVQGSLNVVSAAAKYEHELDDMQLAVSLGGVFGKAKQNLNGSFIYRDPAGIELALAATIDKLKMGINIGSWGKSYNLKPIASGAQNDLINYRNKKHTQYINAAASYDFDCYAISGEFLTAKQQGNKTQLYNFTAHYNLVPGVTPYFEANYFKLTPSSIGVYLLQDKTNNVVTGSGSPPANKGSAFVIGTKITF